MPRKASLKKNDTVEVVDAPSEASLTPTEFVTIQDLMQQSGLAFAMASHTDESIEDTEEDDSPTWEINIDGMPVLESGGVKFSVFTTGESRSGQMVMELLAKPGVNSAVFGWLNKPSERRVKMTVKDHEGNPIENWEMLGTPIAAAIGELDRESKDPWYTTFQVTVKEIKVT